MPQTAVAQNEAGRFVWVVGADGKAVQRQIRAGDWLGADWVVLDGLKAGDTRDRRQPRAAAARARRSRSRRQAECRSFFIHRPVFAGVIAIIIVLAGLVVGEAAGGGAVPGDRAADGADHHLVPGRQRRDARRAPSPRRSRSSSPASRSCSTSAPPRRRTARCRSPPPSSSAPTSTRRCSTSTTACRSRCRACPTRCAATASSCRSARSTSCWWSRSSRRATQRDTLFLSNYASINLVDELKRLPGVADVTIFGARDYSMRVWLNPEKMARLGVTTADVASGAARAERAVRRRAHRRRAGAARAEHRLHRHRDRAPGRARGVRRDRGARQRARRRAAAEGHRAHRARRAQLRHLQHARRPADHRHGDLPAAGRQRARSGRSWCRTSMEELQPALPRGRRLRHPVRHHALRRRLDQGSATRPSSRRRCWCWRWCSCSCRPGARR